MVQTFLEHSPSENFCARRRPQLFAAAGFLLALLAVGLGSTGAMLFWSLFEQAGSTLNLFAELNTDRSLFGGFP